MPFTLEEMRARLHSLRFEILLASLISVFILNMIFPNSAYGGLAQDIFIPFQLIAAIILFEKKKAIVILACSITTLWVVNVFFNTDLQFIVILLYIVFSWKIMIEVFVQIGRAASLSQKSIVASICGLLLIGCCGFYVFMAIEIYQPGSFSGLGQGTQAVNDLFYFTYVTILTIGYGDITPQTWIAKNATVLVAFVGYIYSIVVIAAIVGGVRRKLP